MDDIVLPDELEGTEEALDFEKVPLHEPVKTHVSGVEASKFVTLTFGRFMTLVANHSFEDVIERNQDEEIILSTNLLTDLANSRRFSPATKGPLLLILGLLAGILIAYFLFN